eukprot:CAMPEP_0196573104 /NCGR_PEP_ID=MMETSP1081-20130531/3056_1 /TAXON_ID=36882 /ORGANISM="Pyramimonas amylifera, Strain CCMP720" /LENGTH=325 /DNA_ID=CAMNT_0041890691 /DNA_START=262 /DNA_END=1239 /DNA_ORIENTATION=-
MSSPPLALVPASSSLPPSSSQSTDSSPPSESLVIASYPPPSLPPASLFVSPPQSPKLESSTSVLPPLPQSPQFRLSLSPTQEVVPAPASTSIIPIPSLASLLFSIKFVDINLDSLTGQAYSTFVASLIARASSAVGVSENSISILYVQSGSVVVGFAVSDMTSEQSILLEEQLVASPSSIFTEHEVELMSITKPESMNHATPSEESDSSSSSDDGMMSKLLLLLGGSLAVACIVGALMWIYIRRKGCVDAVDSTSTLRAQAKQRALEDDVGPPNIQQKLPAWDQTEMDPECMLAKSKFVSAPRNKIKLQPVPYQMDMVQQFYEDV